MGLVQSFPMQGGQPSRYRDRARRGGVALPWGGPTGAGGDFVAMSMITNVGGAPQPEIWTLALTGVGTVQLQFGSSGIAATPTLTVTTLTAAQLLVALQTVWPLWVLPAGSVTGATGGPFTITFGPNARIGGLVNFVTSAGVTATLTRTQRGSVGAGQYDLCDGVVNLTCDALLVDNISTGPTGDLSTIPYGAVSDTTFSPWAWIEGFFFAADIPGLTNAIVQASPKLAPYLGGSEATFNPATPGAEVCLTQ